MSMRPNFLMKYFTIVGSIVLALWISVHPANSKVEAPNYTFTYDAFTPYLPGASTPELLQKNGAGEIITKEAKNIIRRYLIKHELYVFPIWVLTSDEIILSMYTRLPSYFLHDVFHQSLINRYGKQDLYFKKEEHAVYTWKNAKGFRLVYEGACTITCFPIYLSVDFFEPPAGVKVPKTMLKYFSP